jgi:hypothetical protein
MRSHGLEVDESVKSKTAKCVNEGNYIFVYCMAYLAVSEALRGI